MKKITNCDVLLQFQVIVETFSEAKKKKKIEVKVNFDY